MARSSTLNKESLVKLGAERLADLLLDEAEGNGPLKKLVMAALAAARGPDAIAAIVDKRLAGLERASGAIGWERVKSFSDDLAAVLKIITGDIAKADAEMAADRLLRFLATADRTLSRTDGSDGEAAHVYHAAAAALPALVGKLSQAQNASLADRLYALAAGSRYRVVLESMPEIIGQSPGSVVDALDTRLASAVSSLGPIDESDRDWNKRMRVRHLIELRQHIADSRGDVDAFIALETSLPGLRPDAADIAERLARAGRHREALDWLRRPTGSTIRMLRVEDIEAGLPPRDPAAERRARLEIDVLEAMGERSEARALRRKSFETTLDAEILRDHLAHLPDFEDVDALDAAFAHALASPLSYAALRFLVAWPRLHLAGSLVVERRAQWDGRRYEILAQAAEALDSAHPLAATILYRALIDSILARGQSLAYPHAARYYSKLDSLAAREDPNWPIEPAQTYRAGLKSRHGRKHGFWGLAEATGRPGKALGDDA